MNVRNIFFPWTIVLVIASAACHDGSLDGGQSGDAGTNQSAENTGFDCNALLKKQEAASCPKFDSANYLKDCNDTKSKIPANCVAQADALANCLLGQTVGCTEDGAIDDTIPTACKSEDDALTSCAPK